MRNIEITAHSKKEYIFSGEETLSYGLKGKKHKKEKQEAKKEAQERDTAKSHIFKVFIPQAQILKFLSRCLNLITGPTPPSQAQIPKFQSQIQGLSTCYYNPLTNYPTFSVRSHI